MGDHNGKEYEGKNTRNFTPVVFPELLCGHKYPRTDRIAWTGQVLNVQAFQEQRSHLERFARPDDRVLRFTIRFNGASSACAGLYVGSGPNDDADSGVYRT